MACYLVILFQQSSLINKEDLSPGKCFLSSVNTWLIIFILICFYNKQYKTLSMTGFIIPFGCNLVSHPLFFFSCPFLCPSLVQLFPWSPLEKGASAPFSSPVCIPGFFPLNLPSIHSFPIAISCLCCALY